MIVGKGGGIVCSLEIPAGYPNQGQVTLTSVMGTTEDVAVAELKVGVPLLTGACKVLTSILQQLSAIFK